MELPESLRSAIMTVADRQPRPSLEVAATALSSGLRASGAAQTIQATGSAAGVVAYAVTRLPATFAALSAALAEAAARVPAWEPRTLLDVGAGPGVSAWAASGIWPTLREALLLERDQRMIALGGELLAESPPEGLEARWRQVDVSGPWGSPIPAQVDLVTCSYTLNELPEARRADIVARLWDCAAGALAIVAPGTPAGFAAIRAARERLIEAGAHILAPCPHDRACPMPPGDWCHMAQRLARSRLHRQLKGGDAPFEDEKFSYIVASRLAGTPIAARVIRRPLVRSGHITLDFCGPDGLEQRDITRSQRAAFRAARDAHWGSAWPLPLEGAGRQHNRPDSLI